MFNLKYKQTQTLSILRITFGGKIVTNVNEGMYNVGYSKKVASNVRFYLSASPFQSNCILPPLLVHL